MTPEQARLAALEAEIESLQKSYMVLKAGLRLATKHAGIDLDPPATPEPEGAVIFALADHRRHTKNRVGGRVAGQVTAFAAPRHATTPGMAAS